MKKIIFRFLAFIIDYIIISIAATAVMFMIPALKTQYNKSLDLMSEETKFYSQYKEINEELDKAYKDGILTNKESIKLYNIYNSRSNLIKVVEEDTEVSEKDLDDLKEKIYDESLETTNKLQYRVNKKTISQQVVVLVLTIVYLGVIQYFTKGVTVGKKIFRLKTVADDGSRISLVKYLLRAVLISAALIKVPELICLATLNMEGFMNANKYISLIRNIYDMAFLICIVFRDDQKSVHDILLHTRVALFDKNGEEVECLMFNDELNKPAEEVKTTTKKPAKKTTKKNKEVVKAEKIDD